MDSMMPTRALLESIIENEELGTVFQPIVSLRTGKCLGYEALTRGPRGTALESPLALFEAAEAANLTWELEYLCRRLAISRFAATGSESLLFLNVNPKIIEDPRFRKGCTYEQIVNGGLMPANVVLEITERASVTNHSEFRGILKHYTDQGFRIAIDDTGAGYSGLNLLANVKPQFVKIDMNLVRGLDKDPFKRSLIRFLSEFATSMHLALIAEGIETEDELSTLVALDVGFGQGYLLGRPERGVGAVSESVVGRLSDAIANTDRNGIRSISTACVGDFAKPYQWLGSGTPCSAVEGIFEANADLSGIPIVDEGMVKGLVMRERFYSYLASKYGYSLYHGRPISFLMDPDPLVMDAKTTIQQANRLAMGRGNPHLYDYLIVTMDNSYYGIVTVKDLLERTTELEVRYARYSQPLTGLPGNVVIEGEVASALTKPRWSVLYIDLDNFKAYNDVYGFNRGDDVILFTAGLLRTVFGDVNGFVGHIGGDDFVVVLDSWDAEPVVRAFIEAFDGGIGWYYSEEDRRKGHIQARNRRGEEEAYSMISVSVAIVHNMGHPFEGYRQVAARASELKHQCKMIPGSCFLS